MMLHRWDVADPKQPPSLPNPIKPVQSDGFIPWSFDFAMILIIPALIAL